MYWCTVHATLRYGTVPEPYGTVPLPVRYNIRTVRYNKVQYVRTVIVFKNSILCEFALDV